MELQCITRLEQALAAAFPAAKTHVRRHFPRCFDGYDAVYLQEACLCARFHFRKYSVLFNQKIC